MHRDMRGVGDEPAVAIEDGAGEVEPLLDVDRARGVLQRIAHLLGDRGEALVEHFEQHRIDAGAERAPRLAFASTRVSSKWFFAVTSACQCGSTTTV